ncbi:Ribonuclease P protein subunit p25-like protein [Merluccius polli]|uniref:Ribonuclease P protein subunit p25-like protein n=1 Tax=Merluccius polli TaxID=89951 RepID=A0AA47P187_MERPO|nr:Ribonuclease P protein subunit p25-like protein [Merluccius polli]
MLPTSTTTTSSTSSSPKPDQSNFRRVGRREDTDPHPIPGLPADILHMRVKEGSKIRNLLRFAVARMQGQGQDQGQGGGWALRQVVFSGSDRSLTKTITCVEILKRQVGGLHQVSKLCNKTVSEAGRAFRRECQDPLDPQEPGYQPPQRLHTVPEEEEQRRDQAQWGGTHGPCGAKRVRLEDRHRDLPSTSSV